MKLNKIKKTVATLLISSIIFTGSSIAFADEDINTDSDNTISTEEYNDIKKEINEIADKYDGEITIGKDALNELDENQEVIKVNSKEELDNLINSVREELLYSENEEVTQDIVPYATGFKTVQYKAGVFKWFYTRCLDFNYETKVVKGKKQLVRVFNRRSYSSGLTALAWKNKWHEAPVYNSSRTSVSMKVHGEWRLGIEYNGLPIGYTFSDIWSFNYSI